MPDGRYEVSGALIPRVQTVSPRGERQPGREGRADRPLLAVGEVAERHLALGLGDGRPQDADCSLLRCPGQRHHATWPAERDRVVLAPRAVADQQVRALRPQPGEVRPVRLTTLIGDQLLDEPGVAVPVPFPDAQPGGQLRPVGRSVCLVPGVQGETSPAVAAQRLGSGEAQIIPVGQSLP